MVPIFFDALEYGRFKKDQDLKTGVGLVLTKEYLQKELQLNR